MACLGLVKGLRHKERRAIGGWYYGDGAIPFLQADERKPFVLKGDL